MGNVERTQTVLSDYTFLSGSFTDAEVTITATNEETARRKAMVYLWGSVPDRIIPHAPNYQGKGLLLQRVVPHQPNPDNRDRQMAPQPSAAAAASRQHTGAP